MVIVVSMGIITGFYGFIKDAEPSLIFVQVTVLMVYLKFIFPFVLPSSEGAIFVGKNFDHRCQEAAVYRVYRFNSLFLRSFC